MTEPTAEPTVTITLSGEYPGEWPDDVRHAQLTADAWKAINLRPYAQFPQVRAAMWTARRDCERAARAMLLAHAAMIEKAERLAAEQAEKEAKRAARAAERAAEQAAREERAAKRAAKAAAKAEAKV